jgi:hypothetical protein
MGGVSASARSTKGVSERAELARGIGAGAFEHHQATVPIGQPADAVEIGREIAGQAQAQLRS